MLFVDFSDAQASRSPENTFAILSPDAEKFYSDVSNARMNLVLEPHYAWLRMSMPSSAYPSASPSFDAQKAFIQEAIDLAGSTLDVSDVRQVRTCGRGVGTR